MSKEEFRENERIVDGTTPPLRGDIEELHFFQCRNLTHFRGFPAGLKKLTVIVAPKLTQLPEFPEGLEELNLPLAVGVTSLPKLPEGLRRVNLGGCNRLVPTPELTAQLQALESRGCQVTYPKPLKEAVATGARAADLREAADAPMEVNDTRDPVHRSIDKVKWFGIDKEKADAILRPVINAVERSAHPAEWIERTAESYKDQPVIGVAAIAAWLSVANAEDAAGRVMAARQLVMIDTIKQFVARIDDPRAPVVTDALSRCVYDTDLTEWRSHVRPLRDRDLPPAATQNSNHWWISRAVDGAVGKAREAEEMPVQELVNRLCAIAGVDEAQTARINETLRAAETRGRAAGQSDEERSRVAIRAIADIVAGFTAPQSARIAGDVMVRDVADAGTVSTRSASSSR